MPTSYDGYGLELKEDGYLLTLPSGHKIHGIPELTTATAAIDLCVRMQVTELGPFGLDFDRVASVLREEG